MNYEYKRFYKIRNLNIRNINSNLIKIRNSTYMNNSTKYIYEFSEAE